MSTLNYEGILMEENSPQLVNDYLSIEVPLEVHINTIPFSTTMCSPSDLEHLVKGLLYTEGITPKGSEITIDIKKDSNRHIHVAKVSSIDQLNTPEEGSRQLLSVTSCGICGSTTFNKTKGDKLPGRPPLANEKVIQLLHQMEQLQSDFKQSGGSHAALLTDINGLQLGFGQDIGRHNAVDKSIGKWLNTRASVKANVLLVSGRLSYEILSKAFVAKIPYVCSVSAPSSLAVDVAKEWGISVYSFCRNKRYTKYS